MGNHIVRTATQEGWENLANGDLLRAAEGAGFEVVLTTDNGFGYQQNLKSRKIAIVVLSRNRWRVVERMIRKIVAAVDRAERAVIPSLKSLVMTEFVGVAVELASSSKRTLMQAALSGCSCGLSICRASPSAVVPLRR